MQYFISKLDLLLYCLYLNLYFNGTKDLACLHEEYIHSNLHTINTLHRTDSCDMILRLILVYARILYFLSHLKHAFMPSLLFSHVFIFFISYVVEEHVVLVHGLPIILACFLFELNYELYYVMLDYDLRDVIQIEFEFRFLFMLCVFIAELLFINDTQVVRLPLVFIQEPQR